MEINIQVHQADKQYTSIVSIAAWSSIACIAALAAICLVKFFQGGTTADDTNTTGILSLRVMLFISAALTVYLLYRFITMRKVLLRLQQVFLKVDGDMISGISLANPMSPDREYPNGRPFSVIISEIVTVEIKQVFLLKQNVAPALFLQTADSLYVVPALADMQDARRQIEDLRAELNAQPFTESK